MLTRTQASRPRPGPRTPQFRPYGQPRTKAKDNIPAQIVVDIYNSWICPQDYRVQTVLTGLLETFEIQKTWVKTAFHTWASTPTQAVTTLLLWIYYKDNLLAYKSKFYLLTLLT